ncbi:MAG: hypothetical protein AAFX39_03375 [Pseudomonadota bacterium]
MMPVAAGHDSGRQTGLLLGRSGLIAIVLMALTIPALAVPAAEVAPREAMRLHLLDTCVINSNRQNDNASVNFADRCRCATDRTMRGLNEEEIASLEGWGGVSRSVEDAFNQNWEACG